MDPETHATDLSPSTPLPVCLQNGYRKYLESLKGINLYQSDDFLDHFSSQKEVAEAAKAEFAHWKQTRRRGRYRGPRPLGQGRVDILDLQPDGRMLQDTLSVEFGVEDSGDLATKVTSADRPLGSSIRIIIQTRMGECPINPPLGAELGLRYRLHPDMFVSESEKFGVRQGDLNQRAVLSHRTVLLLNFRLTSRNSGVYPMTFKSQICQEPDDPDLKTGMLCLKYLWNSH